MKSRILLAPFLTIAVLAAACNEPGGAPAPAPPPSAKPAMADPHGTAPTPLKPGDAAPDITLKLQDGKEIKLSSLAGKQVLVYFYPKDDTPGCTVQAEGLRDGWADLQAAGLEVYGVSMQGAESHQAFIDKYKLPFPLVVDEDGAVAKAFRVPVRGTFAARQSFLIGKDGKIKARWLDVDPKEHASTVIAAAKS
ncbi:MAG TPA: peroxiredoxin [Candidatus Nanopelagicales bacterium]|nr:peroxiredoxin [Candidatus Nanopelagicales bacterium]